VSTNYLRRYTDIPALISVLSERKITLLDPASWDDKNDSRFLALYKDKEKLQSVLALCFTQTDEMYHHWRVFANGSAGVCIRFDRSAAAASMRATHRDGTTTHTGPPLQHRDGCQGRAQESMPRSTPSDQSHVRSRSDEPSPGQQSQWR
jgi:hypothetical protein